MTKLAVLAVAGLAAAASANPHLSATNGNAIAPTQVVNLLDVADVSLSNSRSNEWNIQLTFNQDINYTFGFPNATVFVIDLAAVVGKPAGAEAYIHAIGWNTTHTAFSPSWLREFRIEFTDAGATTGVGLSPSGTAGSGGPENNNSGGSKVDLVGLGLDFTLNPGLLHLTLWDTFNDFGGGNEGVLLAGSWVSIGTKIVPAPGALALLGLGGLASIRRRR
ncbi:MAG: PEP-CTERM sorting domain-containing protein [Phycisphaeraceae bacterium]|nr:PEP-CTERM sorting domain-containing protein [Phycisphaeraceae bacterium]